MEFGGRRELLSDCDRKLTTVAACGFFIFVHFAARKSGHGSNMERKREDLPINAAEQEVPHMS